MAQMGREFTNFKMDLNTKEYGVMVKKKGLENIFLAMEMYTKATSVVD